MIARSQFLSNVFTSAQFQNKNKILKTIYIFLLFSKFDLPIENKEKVVFARAPKGNQIGKNLRSFSHIGLEASSSNFLVSLI